MKSFARILIPVPQSVGKVFIWAFGDVVLTSVCAVCGVGCDNCREMFPVREESGVPLPRIPKTPTPNHQKVRPYTQRVPVG